MRAESQKTSIATRVKNFIVGGPVEVPDSIKNLNILYHTLPAIVFDPQESKALNEALAEVDASTVIARSGADPNDPLVLMYFTRADGKRSFPTQEDLFSSRANARLDAQNLLDNLGVGHQLTVSQPGDKTPTRAKARSLHRILEAQGGPAYLAGESDTNPPIVLFVEEHVSKSIPANPGTYKTERSTTRK